LTFSHLPSKNPQKRRSALRTSTEIFCPSPVACPPKSGHRYAPCSQTDRSHCPKPQRALENWIASVELSSPPQSSARHADIREDFVNAFLQIEVWRTLPDDSTSLLRFQLTDCSRRSFQRDRSVIVAVLIGGSPFSQGFAGSRTDEPPRIAVRARQFEAGDWQSTIRHSPVQIMILSAQSQSAFGFLSCGVDKSGVARPARGRFTPMQ